MSSNRVDERSLRAEIDACAASQAALVAWLHALDPVDPSRPSLLPGWTVGHVLTHLARNAESHLELLAGRPQYPSAAARDTDIAAGAGRDWGALLDDVDRTGAALDAAYTGRTDWSGSVQLLGGPRPLALLPLLRQREVEVHRVDLGLGYGLADLPAGYVRRDLRLLEMQWRARRPMGLTPLPAAALAVPPARRLGWLLGRVDLDGLPAADLR